MALPGQSFCFGKTFNKFSTLFATVSSGHSEMLSVSYSRGYTGQQMANTALGHRSRLNLLACCSKDWT